MVPKYLDVDIYIYIKSADTNNEYTAEQSDPTRIYATRKMVSERKYKYPIYAVAAAWLLILLYIYIYKYIHTYVYLYTSSVRRSDSGRDDDG